MSSRTYYPTGGNQAAGVVTLDFSCTLNGAANPLTSTYHPSISPGIASVVYSTTGTYTVTLQDTFLYHFVCLATLDDMAGDGRYATASAFTAGSGGTGDSFTLYTRAAGGTLTNYSSGRVRLFIRCKNSLVNA